MKISKREKRFILGGALVVLGNFFFVYIVEPVVDSQLEVRKQIQQKQAILERHRAPAPGQDHYQSRLAELKAQLGATEVLFLRDQKPTLAAANLQGLIHKLGEETGLTIVRENVLAPKEIESFIEVPIELSLRGKKKALRDFLFRVQMAPYLLTLPKLIVKDVGSQMNSVLTAEMQVVGYIQAEERK